ncbi:hypothetical protein ACM66B_002542 [Microbotryomycetes sp. NB124-2]
MAPKNRRDKSPPGPTKQQLRNLQYNADASKPAFLRNAIAALSGQTATAATSGASGRSPIPTRPDGQEADESEEDEWDLGRGEEAPAVVVLNERKHLDRQQVDEMRTLAKANNEADPMQAQQAATTDKRRGTLNFASGGGGGQPGSQKRQRAPVGQDYEDDDKQGLEGLDESLSRPAKKKAGAGGTNDDDELAWQSVISASKLDADTKKLAVEEQQKDKFKKAQEAEKAAKKKKKLDKKKIGMLSFDEE